ncbi:hypothetical protein SF123566_2719 [Shigella flexneri 1235-66]|nr:hypothetical protein SF123566_2719 [Shigella flexneri 1235-66]
MNILNPPGRKIHVDAFSSQPNAQRLTKSSAAAGDNGSFTFQHNDASLSW